MRIVILDAKGCLFRFGWAHQALKTSDGGPTGAVYGILGLLLRLKEQYPKARFVMAWDGKGKCWRYNLFPDYKKKRHEGEMPEEVKTILAQEQTVKAVTSAIGIPNLEIAGVEGDDLVGILAAQLSRVNGYRVTIYGADADLVQLTRYADLVRGLDKGKLLVETPETIRNKFGCKPEDVLKLRAITGDSTDEIPGAQRGIGPKTALKLMAAGADPSSREAPEGVLAEAWPTVRRNYKLMKILTSPDSKWLTADQQDRARGALSDAICPNGPAPWKLFLGLLGDLELREAMVRRNDLYRIQECT